MANPSEHYNREEEEADDEEEEETLHEAVRNMDLKLQKMVADSERRATRRSKMPCSLPLMSAIR